MGGAETHIRVVCSESVELACFVDTVGSTITVDTSTHAQGTDLGGGASRASKGQEALCPPVLKARRRRKRQYLHRWRKCGYTSLDDVRIRVA